MAHSSRKPMGTRTLIAGVIITLVTALTAFITPSNADVNAAIAISSPTLTRTDANGDPLTAAEASHPMLVGDHASLAFAWDAAKANIAPGQSMKVGIPASFRTLEPGSQADLTVDVAGKQTAIGQCKLGRNEVDCVFDKTVDSLKARGYAAPKGKVSLRLTALAPTASPAAFTINGGQYKLPIPGGPVRERSKGYNPHTFAKVTPALTSESKSVFWTVSFGADYVAERLRETGQHMRLDGATRSTVTITDTIGPGQKFADPSKWALYHRGSAGDKEVRDVRVTGGSGTDYTAAYGDFDMSVSINGSTATVSITGPWRGQTNYGIAYPTVPDKGRITPNFAYVNTAGLGKTKIVKAAAAKYADPFASSGLVDAQHGSFTVTSRATGPHAEAIPRRVAFPVTARYELPAGTKASDYPSWNPPGTLAADKRTGTFSLAAGIGQKVDAGSKFPAGTKITVTQDSSAALGAPEGVRWGDSSYTVDGEKGNSFVVKANTVHGVAISTEVLSLPSDVKPTPTPSPSTPAPKPSPSSPTPSPSASAPEPSPSSPTPTPSASAPTPSPSATSLASDPATPPEPTPTTPSSHPTPSPTETTPSKPTETPKPSSEPTGTAEPSPSPTSTASPTEEPSPTPSESPTASPSQSASPSESAEPSPTDTPSAKASPSAAPSSPSGVVPPISPSAPTATPSPTDSQSPSGDPGAVNPNGGEPSGKGKPRARRPGSSINSPIVGAPVALPSVARATEERPLIKTGLDMGTGVVFSVSLSLVGTGLVIRRYFS